VFPAEEIKQTKNKKRYYIYVRNVCLLERQSKRAVATRSSEGLGDKNSPRRRARRVFDIVSFRTVANGETQKRP